MVEVRIVEWQLYCTVSAEEVAGLELVSRLDAGPPAITAEVAVDGQVGNRYRLSEASAAYVRERLLQGWRLPPAVCWYGLHGLPILGELMKVRERFSS